MPEFSYTKVPGISPIPIVTVYFNNPLDSSINVACDCGILDTGSDLTIVSYTVISKIRGIAIDRQSGISFRGLGRSAQGIPYRIGVSFNGQDIFRAKVIAVPDDLLNGEVIIGRNILNRYSIEFDGPNLVFRIAT